MHNYSDKELEDIENKILDQLSKKVPVLSGQHVLMVLGKLFLRIFSAILTNENNIADMETIAKVYTMGLFNLIDAHKKKDPNESP